MEERYTPPGSPEVARPVPTALPRSPIADALTQENLRDSPLLRVGRDVHSLIIDRCATVKDAVSLVSSCFTLWSKNEAALFNRVLREAPNLADVDGLGYIADMIEFNPILRRYGINYRHLATILVRARSLLDTMIKTDPNCAWKVAAVCGLKGTVRELLGSRAPDMMDPYGRGVLAYYALGGQLECIKEFIEEHQLQIPLPPEILSTMARMAAIGGHIHVLEYLRDTHGFKLNHIYPAKSEDRLSETLLHDAVMGGNRDTVVFLKQKEHGIDPNVDINLARVASACGHWPLHEELAQEKDPIQNVDDATELAQDAVRRGNLALARKLIKRFKNEEKPIDTKALVMDVIIGGDSITFRYALRKGWFTLSDIFEDGATVQHLLARHGHLDLLIDVLEGVLKDNTEEVVAEVGAFDNNNEKLKPVFALDYIHGTLLHSAAAGGHWKIYRYLLKHYFKNKPIPRDFYNNTPAHSAARAGFVWFLKKLFNSEGGPELFFIRDINDAPILFDAAYCGEPYLLFMIIEEFKIDVRSVDKWGNTVLHILAKLANNDPTFWDVVRDLVMRYPDMGLLDIPDKADPPKTVRQIIFEAEEADALKHLLNLEVIEENNSSEGASFEI